jgi:hypothetical protein
VNTRPVVGVAARLAAGLTIGCAVSIIGVTGRAGVLRAVLAVLMVWFVRFLVFS